MGFFQGFAWEGHLLPQKTTSPQLFLEKTDNFRSWVIFKAIFGVSLFWIAYKLSYLYELLTPSRCSLSKHIASSTNSIQSARPKLKFFLIIRKSTNFSFLCFFVSWEIVSWEIVSSTSFLILSHSPTLGIFLPCLPLFLCLSAQFCPQCGISFSLSLTLDRTFFAQSLNFSLGLNVSIAPYSLLTASPSKLWLLMRRLLFILKLLSPWLLFNFIPNSLFIFSYFLLFCPSNFYLSLSHILCFLLQNVII